MIAAGFQLACLLISANLSLESQPLFSGTDPSLWDKARDQARLAEEYVSNELDSFQDRDRGPTLRWSFSLKSITYSDLFLRQAVEQPFEKIQLWVRNMGAPVQFLVKVGDASGAEWTVAPVPLAGGGPWQQVSWLFKDFHVASWSKDPDGVCDFPLKYLAAITFDLSPGQAYELLLDDVEVLRPAPVPIEVLQVDLPDKIQAGQAFTGGLTLRPGGIVHRDDPVALQWVRDGSVVCEKAVTTAQPMSQWLPGQEVSIKPLSSEAPGFVPGGLYTLRLKAGHTRLLGQVLDDQGGLKMCKLEPRPQGHTRAEVKWHKGAPTLFLNDEPQSSMVYMTYNPNPRYFTQFGQAGVHLYSFSATPSEAAYGLAKPCWTGPETFDYSAFEERVMMVLESDPEAYFFPRLYLFSPPWWDDQHPDDLVTYDPGDGPIQPFFHAPGKRAPSWASESWRQDTIKALCKMIEHIESSPYADRVIGYHLASGTTEEWMMWGANEDQWADYSPVNVERFRSWLRTRYGSDEGLRKAWNDPSCALGSATIPRKKERMATGFGIFRDPQREAKVIDYTLYHSELVADTIQCLSHAVKQATNREKLVGVFYGYVLQLAGEQRQQNAGHLALRKVWDCPDVDFVTSPTSYAFRAPGSGYSHFMSLTDSVRLHGKLWFDENDIRTWLTPGQVGDWGKVETFEGTLGQERRELANVLANACGQWWFDMRGGWYDDPRIMGEISKMRGIADESIAWDRSPVDEIAVVVDDASLCFMQVGNRLSSWLIMQQLPELGRIGAPIGYYALDDLDLLPPHKMMIFLNCFAPTPLHLRRIEKLKADGRVLVWVVAPGIYRNGQLDDSGMQDLTGLHLKWDRTGAPLQVKIAHSDPALEDRVYGADIPVSPVTYSEDAEAVVWGRLLGSDRPGLVVKEFKDWTSVFSAAPALPAGLLRALARKAHVHLYLDPEVLGQDVVYANESLLAVAADAPGIRKIRLRHSSHVRDLFAGQDVKGPVSEFEANMSEHETKLWRIQPAR